MILSERLVTGTISRVARPRKPIDPSDLTRWATARADTSAALAALLATAPDPDTDPLGAVAVITAAVPGHWPTRAVAAALAQRATWREIVAAAGGDPDDPAEVTRANARHHHRAGRVDPARTGPYTLDDITGD